MQDIRYKAFKLVVIDLEVAKTVAIYLLKILMDMIAFFSIVIIGDLTEVLPLSVANLVVFLFC